MDIIRRSMTILLLLGLQSCSHDWNNPLDGKEKPQEQMPTAGLVAWYPFNGNANDESGSGFNGIIHGPILVEDRFGKVGTAYKFDGLNDYIDIGSPLGNNPIEMTQCCWVKLSQLPAQELVLLTKRHDDSGSDWPTLAVETDGSAATVLDDAYYRSNVFSGIKIADNKWHFLCGIRSKAMYKIYVDGLLEKEISDTHPMSGSSAAMHIGHHGSWNCWFKGIVDDVRLYNRALTDSEIRTLFREGDYVLPLNTPEVMAVGLSESSIKISWRAIRNATSYMLEHSASRSGPFSHLTSGADTSYTHTGLAKYQLVWYRVKARSTSAASAWSDSISATASLIPTQGLIAYYPFNGNTNDESGNRHNATNIGATLAADRHSINNQAYYFSGANNYMTVPSLALNSFTITAWVYRSSAPGGWRSVVSKPVGGGDENSIYLAFKENN